MHKYFLIVAIFYFSEVASAEKLIFPHSLELGAWSFDEEIPILVDDVKAIGLIKSYSLATNGSANLKSLMITTEVVRKPTDGPVGQQMGIAKKIKGDCEDVYFDVMPKTIENTVPVSYMLVFCTNHRTLGGGVIKIVKALQGLTHMFTVSREWYVPPFRMPLEYSDHIDLAKSIFKSSEMRSTWLNEYDLTTKYLVNLVTLCAQNPGEYGKFCKTNKL